METIHVSRDRLNAYRLARQCLEPRGTDLATVLEAVGCLPSREAGFLALLVRYPGFRGEMLNRLVFEEHAFVEMASLRDQSLVVPKALAPSVLRCLSPQRKENAERMLAGAGLATAQRLAIRYGVVEVLEKGPLSAVGLSERLSEAGGEVEGLAVRTGVLAAVLALLQVEGQVVRTNLSGDLLRGKVSYILAEQLFGDEEVTGIDPVEAVRALCAFYFRVHGPATPADFGWWSGAGAEEAAEAFRAIRHTLVRVETEGMPYGLYMPAAYRDELAAFDHGVSRPVVLVPFRDAWLSSHEGRAGRFLAGEDFLRLVPGPALPSVLVAGFAAGRWSLDAANGSVRVAWFRRPPEACEARAEEIGREIGAFAAREMADLAPLTVPARDGPFTVYGPA
jgi:hypothetical protein